jgi:hypothetical protein
MLSSWIRRIAEDYNIPYVRFCTKVLLIENSQRKNLDNFPKISLLKQLSKSTGIWLKVIKSCTLYRYDKVLFVSKKKKVLDPSFNKISLQEISLHKGIKFASFLPWHYVGCERLGEPTQYCPLCFELDKRSYFRLTWQIPLITICTKHRIILFDRCWSCKRGIMIRTTTFTNPSKCYWCCAQLENVSVIYASNSLCSLTFHIEQILLYGKTNFYGKSYSSFFFLAILLYVLMNIYKDGFILESYSFLNNCFNNVTKFMIRFKNWFESLIISDRATLLSRAGELFEYKSNIDGYERAILDKNNYKPIYPKYKC